MRERWDLVVVTNDIYTKEDQRLLTVSGALAPERIMGVETGGCPHTAIREDASINLEAVDRMLEKFPDADIVFIESGGDNLAATFSPELSDLTIYVIDVAAGEKIPRKGGPGITKSDLFVINKTDLAPHVGADLGVMETDTRRMRTTAQGLKPFVMTNLKTQDRSGRGDPLHRDQGIAGHGLSGTQAWSLGASAARASRNACEKLSLQAAAGPQVRLHQGQLEGNGDAESGRTCKCADAIASAVNGLTMASPRPCLTHSQTETALAVSTVNSRLTPASVNSPSICWR